MMSRIVADADGLIKLGRSGALAALLSEAEVLVPEAVYEETVVVGKKEMYEDAFELERALGEGEAKIVPTLEDGRAAKILEGVTSLGAGERAALHATFASGADAVLTDDRAFLGVLTRAGIAALVPAAAIVSLADAGSMSLEEAVAALGRIEDSMRREVYETAVQELDALREERG